jgi:hypothetical protein
LVHSSSKFIPKKGEARFMFSSASVVVCDNSMGASLHSS